MKVLVCYLWQMKVIFQVAHNTCLKEILSSSKQFTRIADTLWLEHSWYCRSVIWFSDAGWYSDKVGREMLVICQKWCCLVGQNPGVITKSRSQLRGGPSLFSQNSHLSQAAMWKRPDILQEHVRFLLLCHRCRYILTKSMGGLVIPLILPAYFVCSWQPMFFISSFVLVIVISLGHSAIQLWCFQIKALQKKNVYFRHWYFIPLSMQNRVFVIQKKGPTCPNW